MDALAGIVSKLGGFFGNGDGGANWGNIGKTIGVAGLGDQFITNWMEQRKLNDYNRQQQMFQRNPTLAQNQITAMTQPLDQNLVAAVTNQVQGNLGQQGLSQSPNIEATVLAQALAPFNQQNIQQATQLWEAIHSQPPQFGQSNMNPLFAMLLRGFGGSGGGGQGNLPTNTVPGLDALLFPPGSGSSDSATGLGDLFNWGTGGVDGGAVA